MMTALTRVSDILGYWISFGLIIVFKGRSSYNDRSARGKTPDLLVRCYAVLEGYFWKSPFLPLSVIIHPLNLFAL